MCTKCKTYRYKEIYVKKIVLLEGKMMTVIIVPFSFAQQDS